MYQINSSVLGALVNQEETNYKEEKAQWQQILEVDHFWMITDEFEVVI
jgi:hypothetical protein